MANFLQILVPLLCFLVFIIAVIKMRKERRGTGPEHANPVRSQGESTSFTYDFYGDQPTDLTYQGAAHFPSDSTYLRLTDAVTYSIGRVVHSSPVLFQAGGAQADFETTLKFRITAVDGTPADGLTFFVAPVGHGIPAGSTGGNFGIFNPSGSTPSVVAVEFDTAINSWDPSNRHVGIDIESSTSSNVTSVDDDALIGKEVTARISYVGATKLISVRVDAGSQVFEVSYVRDLSAVLPEQVQVGISAATGASVAIHDVVSWYFTSTLVHTGAAAAGNEAAHIRQVT